MIKKLPMLALCSVLLIGLVYWTHNPNNQTTEMTPEEMRIEQYKAKRERKMKGHAKFDNPSEYIKLQYELRTAADQSAPGYPANYQFIELEKARIRAAANPSALRTQNLTWVERGPANVPGRTRGILIDKRDAQRRTWYAASASGGIWKTTDDGASWRHMTEGLPNLALTTLANSDAKPEVIYAGTGEGFGNLDAVRGNGVFKSTDWGETWTQLSSTVANPSFSFVNRILVDPANENYVVAVTNLGAYYSEDGGDTWNESISMVGRVQDLRANPQDFNVLYAAVNGRGVIKSTDAGKTWTFKNRGMFSGSRYEIAVSPANPNRLFAGVENGAASSDLYISDDAGENWFKAIQSNNGANENWLGGQGWYDNTVEAHPFDENMVFLGGINQWRATIVDGEIVSDSQLLNFDSSTAPFITFVNFGGTSFGGTVTAGNPTSGLASVEVRFGSGATQKAHRFTVPDGAGAGVPANQYTYRDYVDVPFEVWDITNNKQLMVSYRDQENNGIFDLEEASTTNDAKAREYIYINGIDYNATTPNANIATNGGHEHQQMYFFWPRLTPGFVWDPANLPDSKIKIEYGAAVARIRNLQNVTDGYNQFGGKNSYVHVDQHNIVPVVIDADAKTFKIILGNDGGVYVSQTGTEPGFNSNTWSTEVNGFNTTQFYGVDKRPGTMEFIGGTQDNGTWKSPSGTSATATTNYEFMIGGDGFEVLWNNRDPNQLIGGFQFNGFRRSTNNGQSWSNVAPPDTGSDNAPFVSRLANSKSNPDIIFTIGARGVWRSDNFGAGWGLVNLSTNFTLSSTSNVEVSLAKSKVVWAYNAMAVNDRVHVSVNGGQSFTQTEVYTGQILGRLSGFATDPIDWRTAYALSSFAGRPKVLKTTDLGQTWSDISGYDANSTSNNGFPDVAVYCLLVMPHNPQIIWAGTEIGIVESTDGGQSWNIADNGFPSVSIWEMKTMDDQVIIATHGRGLWTATIPELPQVAFDPILSRVTPNPLVNSISVQADLRTPYDSTLVFFNEQLVRSTPNNPAVGSRTITIENVSDGEYEVLVRSYKGGREYESYSSRVIFNRILSTKEEVEDNSGMILFPNPTNGLFSIQLEKPAADWLELTVTNYLGQKISERIIPLDPSMSNAINMDISSNKPGIYIIHVKNGSKTYTQRIIKQ